MVSNLGKCQLCLQEKPLRKSHILPKFLFKPLIRHDGKFTEISTVPGKRNVRRPTGHYERLLCEECEGKISAWETYASTVYEGKVGIQRDQWIIIPGIDYQRFKLFQMSLLFRAHVSSLELFKEVDLGKFGEPLRKMLLDENPGKHYDYGCLVTTDPHLPEEFIELIMQPERIDIEDGYTTYRFFLNGYFHIYFVSDHNHQIPASRMFLQEDGTLHIRLDPKGTELIRKISRDFVSSGNIPRNT